MTSSNIDKFQTTRRGLLKGAAAMTGAAAVMGAFPAPSLAAGSAINVLSLGEGMFGQPFVDLSSEFTKATGIKVNNITMGYNEAIQKQVAAFAANSSAYDVVQVDSIYLKGYAKAGHLLPLDDLIAADELKDFFSDIPQSFREMYGADGKTYGMATIGNCQRLIYNKAHLDAAGLAAPETWDDLLTASQKVVDTDANRFGFIAGTEKLAKAFSVWLPIYWANGGVLFDDKMKPIFADQNGVDTLAFLLELVKTMPPGGAAYTEGDEVKAMASGLGTLDPVAWIPDAHVTADAKVKAELVSAVPPKGKVTTAPVMGGLGLTVSRYGQDPKASAQYVAWFNSREVQSNMIVQHGGQPCRNSAWEANASAKPWFPAVAASLKVAKVRPQIPEWSQVDGEVGVQLSRAFAGEISPKEALQTAQSSVDEIMRDAGYY
ncbi:ABC transporter substrate-binding protein [Rhizobium leguminosarum]|uniref:ABC transporter substrate-binding protein n=1 Tax=Rhizobium leguminosarum TaxID=384 RepID=UPI001C901E9D|nr:sugar ABC transporter substrate-binding protein [Rhizobium leguminosarum]MBY3002046.1 sugar ABC transporter substrate-binding protein [Rhizobium leguminosarum]